jgi:hypothetical protein
MEWILIGFVIAIGIGYMIDTRKNKHDPVKYDEDEFR